MTLPTTRPELAGTFGMVASTHWLASSVGMSLLERGGNAFDAAVAAGFVLQVVEPHLNGPGGDLPVVLWSSVDQAAHVVCGQGPAPAGATVEEFDGLGLDAVPGTGLLAAVVPGAFGAWLTLLERWGTMRLRDVLEPAIAYARDGAPTLPRVAATLAAVTPMFLRDWPTSADAWLSGGNAPAAWSRLRQPRIADTYDRVLAEAEAASRTRDGQIAAARDVWYRGFVAEAIGEFCAGRPWRDSSGQEHRGLLTADDLAGWHATVEPPVVTPYRQYEVCKTGPWGQGPVFGQQLRLLEELDLAGLDPEGTDWVHLVTEAAKLAFADREAWYGDPSVVDVPLDVLLSRDYAKHRSALVSEDASLDLRPGSPAGLPPRVARRLVEQFTQGPGTRPSGQPEGVGEPTVRADGASPGDTCHVDVLDRWGNLVSATPSGGWLQSSPVIPALGFPLGTRAQMFWLEPGLAASLRPGARPRTTLSPSLALRDGEPWLAFGTPGGDQQDQWSLHFFVRLVHEREAGRGGLQATIDAPMAHSDHVPSSFFPREALPGRLLLESRYPERTGRELARRGHEVVDAGPWTLGRLSAVERDGGWLRAGANPRGAQGYAVGR